MKNFTLLTITLIFAYSSVSFAADRANINIKCEPTPENLVYDCILKVMSKKSGALLDGAVVMVKADMPTMAMAHNVPIVEAVKGDRPGHYNARMNLKMHGDWALTIDISGPFRDRVVKKLKFGSPMVVKHKH